FISLGHWSSAGSFGFNTDNLATNPINLSVVIVVLIFFGKGVCVSCLFQEIGWIQSVVPFSVITRKGRHMISRIT
ncbi:ATP synthase subunit b chloroplastic, partial [Phtheirospermum japonicum]